MKMTAGGVAVPTIIPLRPPSGPKHVIDSDTEIELRSATPDTLIYYTLNGSRPNPFQRLGESHTHFYQTPFTVSLGKVTIKAQAVSRDRVKESSVVTKTFVVHEPPEGMGDGEERREEEEVSPIAVSSPPKQLSLSAQLKHRLNLLSKSGTSLLPPTSPTPSTLPHSTSAPLTTTRLIGVATDSSVAMATSRSRLGTMTSTRPPTREKPKPVCLYCNTPRPKHPHYKYCTHCGSRLPPLPSSSSSSDTHPPLQMALCPGCRAEMPPGTGKCLVCETTVLAPQPPPVIQAHADTQQEMKGKSVCFDCGAANPPGIQECITCENRLPSPSPSPPPSLPPPTPPPLPTPTTMRPVSGSSFVMCGVCGRVNVSDARFCDWCGSKPDSSQLSVQCASCSTGNEWHARHCYSCGGLIKAPLRPGVELDSTMKMPTTAEFPRNAWIPVVEVEDRGPELREKGTQTTGIFYPSSKSISSQKGAEFTHKMFKATSQDWVVRLDGYSPGKGLWRMQVEHVCSHLKAHSLSSPDFQAGIGSPEIGKLLRADVEEEDGELDLHLRFSLKNGARSSSSAALRAGPATSLSPTPSAGQTLSKKHSTTTTSRRRTSTLPKPSGKTQQLIAEVSASGLGRTERVKELIQQGADINAVDGGGLPVLSLATASGHVECIEVLVAGGGANVNAKAKSTGNTALHQAVLKGPTRVNCIEALLGQGANARLRNKDGLTPCDLAVKLKHEEIVTCFATYVGAGLLDSLRKAQPSLTL